MRLIQRASRSVEFFVWMFAGAKKLQAETHRKMPIRNLNIWMAHKITEPRTSLKQNKRNRLLANHVRFDSQLTQLFGVHRRWRLRQHTDGTLTLRKRNDIPQGFCTAQKHRQPVDAEGNTAVGWRPEA